MKHFWNDAECRAALRKAHRLTTALLILIFLTIGGCICLWILKY